MNMINLLVFGKETIIIIAIIVIALILGLVIYIFTSNHSRIKKMVKEVTKKYDKVYNLLNTQLVDELNRLGAIAKINPNYEANYESSRELYKEIVKNEQLIASQAVSQLDKYLADKKYKNVKEEIDSVRKKIADFEKKFERLNQSLEYVIKIDEENRHGILDYRRRFRNIKDVYESKKNELKYIEESFVTLFEKIENEFVYVEKLLDAAHYEEAKKKFPEIDKVLIVLEKTIVMLPKLVTLSYIVLPAKIDEMLNRYQMMIEQNYPLHHLRVQSTAETFKKELEEIYEKLKKFQTKNIDFELSNIQEAIIKMMDSFDEEEKSKIFFKNNYETIYSGSYKLENRFIKLRRSIPDYKTTYRLRDTSLDCIEKIQNEINELGMIKRNLDTYIHASSQQPFSTLTTRLEELSEKMEQIDNDINEIQTYLSSLKKETEKSYEYITKTYLLLKDEESKIRQINVPKYTLMMKSQFDQCYAYLNQAGEILQQLPIDVDALNLILNDAKLSIDNTLIVTSDVDEISRKAEESIVMANQYRRELYDVQSSLKKVEAIFAEGDFKHSLEESSSIIKKFKIKGDN